MERINNIPELKTLRKELRSNLTPAEAKLWLLLKNSQVDNLKFRRQHSIGRYFVDFFCPKYNLAVELDGSVHDNVTRMEYDEERTAFLNSVGVEVIRFKNKDVFEKTEVVLETIKQKCINKRF